MGVDVQLIFTNESVIPNATSIEDNLKTGIQESNVFLASVNISSIIVGEFSFSQAVLCVYIYIYIYICVCVYIYINNIFAFSG